MHEPTYAWPVAGLWLAWLAYWLVAARNVKDVRRREPLASRLTHIVPLTIGAVLLASRHLPVSWLYERFRPQSVLVYWAGVAIVAAGLAIAVWARRHLGRNWSGTVTLKREHELIRSGPYRFVRHPIYSGLLLALLGTAIVIGQWRGILAFVLMVGALVLKLRTEERFMVETFHDDYSRYRAEVPALIPRVFRFGHDTGA